MDQNAVPLIKGMFVNSHIKRLRSTKGDDAVKSVEARLGRPAVYKNLEDVPVKDEVEIIEACLDILTDNKYTDPKMRSLEAGKLHFDNFLSTPFGKIVMAAEPLDGIGFKKLMLNAPRIARHIFRNTNFSVEGIGPSAVNVVMENNNYPIEHFKGLFLEWMNRWNLIEPEIEARESDPEKFTYFMRWKKKL